MTRLATLNLLHLFEFYLAAMFLLSTVRRLGQYRAVGGILVAAPARWPNLLRVMKQHGTLFLTWTTFRPAALALSLVVVNLVASRVVWPHADLTVNHLADSWFIVPLLLLAAIPMIACDMYFLIRVSQINQAETAAYLDMAEGWLKGWKAPVVRFVTLGYIDPRQRVSDEVRKALESINGLVNTNLYWMALQIGLRVVFGLALWLSWAFLARGR
jgi:hypothetical protein